MKHGWVKKNLGDICHVIGGGTPSKAKEEYFKGVIPWATIRDMRSELIANTEYKITDAAVKNSSTNIIPGGNVVIATRVGLGKVCILGQDTAINQDIRGIVPLDIGSINIRFLFLWLTSIADLIVAEGTGATVQGVKLPFIKSLQVPLPLLPEQQRIVAILDEAFDGIATAKANAEKNLKNARELFESHLQSVFTQRGDGWVERTLGELATFRNGINFTKSSKGESIKILGVKDFQNNYWAPLDDLESVIPEGTLPDSDILQKDDLIFVRSNGNPELIGRCLLTGDVSERTTHSGFTIRARLHTAEISSNYLCHFLKSEKAHRKMIDGGNGVNIKSLNQGTLSDLVIPFPILHTAQIHIVIQLEAIQDEVQRLQSIYQQKITALDELKKSLLHKAFSGEL